MTENKIKNLTFNIDILIKSKFIIKNKILSFDVFIINLFIKLLNIIKVFITNNY